MNHILGCKIEGYNDMGHLMPQVSFTNNTIFLPNIVQIERDAKTFFHDNIMKIVEATYKTYPGGSITSGPVACIYRLKDQNQRSIYHQFDYPNVTVQLEITMH